MRRLSQKRVVDYVFQMDHAELVQIIKAVGFRWREQYPDNELFVLSVPREGPQEQKRLLETALRIVDRNEEEREAQRERFMKKACRSHSKAVPSLLPRRKKKLICDITEKPMKFL